MKIPISKQRKRDKSEAYDAYKALDRFLEGLFLEKNIWLPLCPLSSESIFFNP